VLLRCALLLIACAGYAGVLWVTAFGADLLAVQSVSVMQRASRLAVLIALIAAAGWLARRLGRRASAGLLGMLFAAASPFAFDWLVGVPGARAWLGLAWPLLGALVAVALSSVAFRGVARQVGLIAIVCACASGLLASAAWIEAFRQAGEAGNAVWRGALNGPAVVINVPDALRIPNNGVALPVMPLPMPRDAVAAQMIDGPVLAPGNINGFEAVYDAAQPRWYPADFKRSYKPGMSVYAGLPFKGGVYRALPLLLVLPTVAPIATLTQGDATVHVMRADACRYLGDTVRVRVMFRVLSGAPTSDKFFRQTFRDGQKTGASEAPLAGGLLDLHEVGDATVVDAAFFDAPGASEAMIGVYDWQSGERWLAVDAAGVQLPENAYKLPVQAVCEP
jgi:hypothetical protein